MADGVDIFGVVMLAAVIALFLWSWLGGDQRDDDAR